jgi:hypothetical protein
MLREGLDLETIISRSSIFELTFMKAMSFRETEQHEVQENKIDPKSILHLDY